jgi:CRISPR-associated endonuclease Cas2
MATKKKTSQIDLLLSELLDGSAKTLTALLSIGASGGRSLLRSDWPFRGDVIALSHRQRQQAARAMMRQKLIKKRKDGDKILITLTDKGIQRVIRLAARRAEACPKHEYILCIFDIPETERFVRRQLRAFLSENGFVQVQRSVWMIEKEIEDVLQLFLDRLGADDEWIQVFRARRVRRTQRTISKKRKKRGMKKSKNYDSRTHR